MLTLSELIERYLAWLKAHRSYALWREARRHLRRFAEAYGKLDALAISGAHLEAFQEEIAAQGHALMYVRKHATSVRACFAKGVKMGWLPLGFRPFANVESIRLDPNPLLESELMTDAEREALFAHAKPFFRDMLRVYYHTGARTHELIEACCRDFQPQSRTLVLGKHKRSKTLRDPIPRTILLNDDAYAIVQARCEGREPGEWIWPNAKGKAFTNVLLGDMFARVRAHAGVRTSITIYSFRHLWISEMLMAGHDALIVAKMAGTSVKMIETTYGHFRASSFAEAQAKLDAVRGQGKGLPQGGEGGKGS